MVKAWVDTGSHSELLLELLLKQCKSVVLTLLRQVYCSWPTSFTTKSHFIFLSHSSFRYHIPRPFLKSKDNLLAVFEEEMGKPDGILVQTVTRDDICLLISEHNPGQIKTWDTDGDKIKLIAEDHSRRGTLMCPPEKTIQEVVFASFGNPDGMCGNFTVGTCHTPNAKQIVEKVHASSR